MEIGHGQWSFVTSTCLTVPNEFNWKNSKDSATHRAVWPLSVAGHEHPAPLGANIYRLSIVLFPGCDSNPLQPIHTDTGWPSVPEAASTALPPPPVLSTPTPHMLDGPPRLSVPRCRGPHARSTAGPGPPSRHPRCIMHDPALALSRFFPLGVAWREVCWGLQCALEAITENVASLLGAPGPRPLFFLEGFF